MSIKKRQKIVDQFNNPTVSLTTPLINYLNYIRAMTLCSC